MSGRLDDEKLDTLRTWGAGLAADDRDELRAAGKAILILVDEIDRLQVDIWHARGRAQVEPDVAFDGSHVLPAEEQPIEGEDAELASSLVARLRRLLGARS